MSSSQSGEGDIRRSLIEADLVDCMVALPAQLFYSTQIPVCVWILARDKGERRFRDRRGEVLFIDARGLGALVDRIHVELRDEEIGRVAALYHAFRGDAGAPPHADVPGLCRAATLEDIRRHRHALVPGRYVGFDRGAGARWDRAELGRELLEIEARLEAVQASAAAAVRMLKELLDG
jgi:type I restriction enzyme M protein